MPQLFLKGVVGPSSRPPSIAMPKTQKTEAKKNPKNMTKAELIKALKKSQAETANVKRPLFAPVICFFLLSLGPLWRPPAPPLNPT